MRQFVHVYLNSDLLQTWQKIGRRGGMLRGNLEHATCRGLELKPQPGTNNTTIFIGSTGDSL